MFFYWLLNFSIIGSQIFTSQKFLKCCNTKLYPFHQYNPIIPQYQHCHRITNRDLFREANSNIWIDIVRLCEFKTQKFLLLPTGFEPVTSCVRGGQLDQTSTEVCKNITALKVTQNSKFAITERLDYRFFQIQEVNRRLWKKIFESISPLGDRSPIQNLHKRWIRILQIPSDALCDVILAYFW